MISAGVDPDDVEFATRTGNVRRYFCPNGQEPMTTCPVCGAVVDLSPEPYRCATGVFSNEQCLHTIESIMLQEMAAASAEVNITEASSAPD